MTLSRRAMVLSMGVAALPTFANVGGVEIGVCGSNDDFSKAVSYGFDYYEPSAVAISTLSDQAFVDFLEQVLASRLRCRSVNSLIRTLQVVGDQANLDELSAYLDSTLDRCRQLGVRIAVWGSAASRNVPDGYSRERAWQQITAFLNRAGEIARSKEIVIGIEPLREQESNIINSGAEALRLVHEVAHPNVKMIIDYYHMRVENEDSDILRTAREHIVHLHFANPNGRVWPKSVEEDREYTRFFDLVKKTGYRGGLSIEGKGTFDEDAAASLAFFQKLLK
jgi:D-psicose/D-tagatose/L-ribulose 3-epimerase